MKNRITVLGKLCLLVTLSSGIYGNTIISNYTNMATANYKDVLRDAKELKIAIDNFSKDPTKEGLEKSKQAWLNARESYGESEIFRLANGPIDAQEGWVSDTYGSLEPQINAWPLDENMIDYTIDEDGKKTSGNIIDSVVKIKTISVKIITALNEKGGVANVATGYHAIEFLLWGQDQDYSNFLKDSVTKGAMIAGERPLSDFSSDPFASRRLEYLKSASSKMVSDLSLVASGWSTNISKNCSLDGEGCYRGALNNLLKGVDAKKNIPQKEAIKQILSGMGVFIKSEVANERIAVAVLTPSEEDEHSCFSDNTHRDIASNYQGFKNLLTGRYKGIKGKSFLDKVDAKTLQKIAKLMKSIEKRIDSINKVATTTAHFDYQIQPNHPQARVIVKLKNLMRKLGDMMIVVALQNGVDLTSDDVTDKDETQL